MPPSVALSFVPPASSQTQRRGRRTMGTDYHRGENQAIPAQREYLPKPRPGSPQDHYSTDSGEWDGQLPHSDIADQSNDPAQHQSPTWPGIIERLNWTRAVIRAQKLPPPQAAVLNEIAFRDGRGLGCTATIATLALDTGYSEKPIRLAIQALEKQAIIMANGTQGQKKIMRLPVTDGKLPWPTSVPGTEVYTQDEPQLRSQKPKFEEQPQTQHRSEKPKLSPTSVAETEVAPGHHPPTSVRETEVDPNFGRSDQATSVAETDITVIKQEREREEYINISLSPDSLPGSPVAATEVSPAPDPEHRSEVPPRQQPTSVTESELADQRPGPELERIHALVVQNWPLLEKNGWQFLEAAIRHYQTHGITYLQRDLRVKQENLQRLEQATRTCAHCNTVQESTDQLRDCAMCHQPKCVSELNPCYRAGCDGNPASRNRSRPQSRQRQ